MIIYVQDRCGNEHEIICKEWKEDNERYIFYDIDIVAIFQKSAIVGFTIVRK